MSPYKRIMTARATSNSIKANHHFRIYAEDATILRSKKRPKIDLIHSTI